MIIVIGINPADWIVRWGSTPCSAPLSRVLPRIIFIPLTMSISPVDNWMPRITERGMYAPNLSMDLVAPINTRHTNMRNAEAWIWGAVIDVAMA